MMIIIIIVIIIITIMIMMIISIINDHPRPNKLQLEDLDIIVTMTNNYEKVLMVMLMREGACYPAGARSAPAGPIGTKGPEGTFRPGPGPGTNPENSNGWNERNFGGFEPVYPVFHVGGPKRAILALFWAPGGPGPIRKRQFGRHAKTAAENGSNLVRLLKCHVRRERGAHSWARGPLGCRSGGPCQPTWLIFWSQTEKI